VVIRGLVLVALAAVSWGTTGSVSTVLAERAAATPVLVGLARTWVAGALLAGAAVLTGRVAVAREDRTRSVLMGLAMAAYQVAFFSAVPRSGIAVAALVAICSAPLMITAFAAAFLGERLSPRDRAALVLGVLGTAFLLGAPAPPGPPGGFFAGVLLALAAGVAYAIYVVLAKASVARSAPLPLAATTFTVAAIVLTPSLAWIDAAGPQVAAGWPWLLYLGGVATAGAYALHTAGLRWVPASVAGIVGLLEPVTATGLGVLVFGERLGAAGVAGGLLLLAALTALVTARR
jgi:DME family drug/metabolite transporter